MKGFYKIIILALSFGLTPALFLTSCQNRCKEYDKVYDGFPYYNGEIVKFKVSDSVLTSQVLGIAVEVNKRKPSNGCDYSNTAEWILEDSLGNIPVQFVIAGANGAYAMGIRTPINAGSGQSFVSPKKLVSLQIGGYIYNDIFDPTTAIHVGEDSAWFSRSKGLVKLKYKGKTYERVL